MSPFWTGFLLGWVLFIPSVVALWMLWQVAANKIETPVFCISRNAGWRYFKASEDKEKQLTFLDDVGFDTKHLGGRWYWITRKKG